MAIRWTQMPVQAPLHLAYCLFDPSIRGVRRAFREETDSKHDKVYLSPPSSEVYPSKKTKRPACFFYLGDLILVGHHEVFTKSALLGRVLSVDIDNHVVECQFFRPAVDCVPHMGNLPAVPKGVPEYIATPLKFTAPLSHFLKKIDLKDISIVRYWEEDDRNSGRLEEYDPVKHWMRAVGEPLQQDPLVGMVQVIKRRRESNPDRIRSERAKAYLETIQFLLESLFHGARMSKAFRTDLKRVAMGILDQLRETEHIEDVTLSDEENQKKRRRKE